MADAWVGVAVAAHVVRGMQEGFAPFSHGARAAAAPPAQGNRIICLAPKETADGLAVQTFVALGMILDGKPHEHDIGDVRPWGCRVAREPVSRTPLDRLPFVSGKRAWGITFRRSPAPVPAADFALIEAAVRHG